VRVARQVARARMAAAERRHCLAWGGCTSGGTPEPPQGHSGSLFPPLRPPLLPPHLPALPLPLPLPLPLSPPYPPQPYPLILLCSASPTNTTFPCSLPSGTAYPWSKTTCEVQRLQAVGRRAHVGQAVNSSPRLSVPPPRLSTLVHSACTHEARPPEGPPSGEAEGAPLILCASLATPPCKSAALPLLLVLVLVLALPLLLSESPPLTHPQVPIPTPPPNLFHV